MQDAEIIVCFLQSACQFSLTPVPSLQTDHSTCHLFSAVITSQIISMHLSDPDDQPSPALEMLMHFAYNFNGVAIVLCIG